MVRIATVRDAEQLEILNNEFNGEGETTLDNIRNSLANNKQEVIVVDEQNGELTGFVCVQLHHLRSRQMAVSRWQADHGRERIEVGSDSWTWQSAWNCGEDAYPCTRTVTDRRYDQRGTCVSQFGR